MNCPSQRGAAISATLRYTLGMTVTVELSDAEAAELHERAKSLGVPAEDLARAAVADLLGQPADDFEAAATAVLNKNAELYERLS